MTSITKEFIAELLRLKSDGSLYHREQKDLEFKESFNLNGLAEYFRDFAAFANNSGGYIIFGVTNSPRRLKGLNARSLDQFNKIDPARISGYLNEHFAPYIDWEMDLVENNSKTFGVFYIYKCQTKPVICKKGDDRSIIKNGEVYYRYAGRSEAIQYSELSNIIENRIKENNNQWLNKVKKIGEIGPSNVGILDTLSGVVESDGATMLIDTDLVKKLKFIKEGEFKEKSGAKALKLVGSVQPIDTVEIEKIVRKKLIDEYPYSYKKLEQVIRQRKSDIKTNEIQRAIKENDLKNNPNYSAYNFRNKDQEEEYQKSGYVPGGINSIYNDRAVDFLIKVITENR